MEEAVAAFGADATGEDTPENRLLSHKRARKNLTPADPPDTRCQLDAAIALLEEEVARRQSPSSLGSPGSWRRHLEMLRQELEDQATIFSDVTVTGRELPGVSGVLPTAARFLAARHKAHAAFFHPKSSAASEFKVETLTDLLDVIREHPRVAILGEPGAGKSTTLVALAHSLADSALVALDEGQPVAEIPVFVELGGMSGEGLEDYVIRLLAASGRLLDVDTLRSGETVLFLDGLNEVSPEDAAEVRRWLAQHASARVVVSCRKIDYVDRDLPLRRIEIQPLDPGQIYGQILKYLPKRDGDRLFWALAGGEATNCWRWYNRTVAAPSFDDFWFGHVGPTFGYEVDKRRLAELQTAAQTGVALPGMLSVVANPMLLLAAIILFIGNNSLPTRREALIEEVALSLLERVDIRALAAGHEYPPGGHRAIEIAVGAAVATVAYRMLREAHGTGVASSWVSTVIESVTDLVSGDLLVFELERAGVLERYGGAQKIVKFRHQLLQEYFASVLLESEIREGLAPEDFWDAVPQRMPTAWDEVVLLVAGRVLDADTFVTWVAAGNPSLAVRAADTTRERCDPSLAESLLRGDIGVAPCPIGRARWWRREAHRDERAGVRCRADGLPNLAWQRIPPGHFSLGHSSVPRELGIAVLDEFDINFQYDYAMTRYQITRSQFGSFVTRAYGRQEHWCELGFTWKGAQNEPRYWNDPEFGTIDNQPVIGVTWFEADAFARWVNRLFRSSLSMQPAWMEGEWEVSLPLVCEWEYAARYPDGRLFPWGDTYVAGNANIDERLEGSVVGPYFLQRPTPVGLYEGGVSELGVYDMCGNVWEWCASKWVPGYEFPERTEVDSVGHRAVRGGSWYNSAVYGASACHDCHDMDLGVNDIGFRLVARPVGSEPRLSV